MTDPTGDTAGTRARLRDAALDLFGRQGIQATSTREIIKTAGMRNPSAITYYFGSKAKLVEDLTHGVNGSQSVLLQQHIALASGPDSLSVEAWARIGVDFVVDLMSTERGCHLIRVWGEHDDLNPDRVEQFLAGTHPVAQCRPHDVSRASADGGNRPERHRDPDPAMDHVDILAGPTTLGEADLVQT